MVCEKHDFSTGYLFLERGRNNDYFCILEGHKGENNDFQNKRTNHRVDINIKTDSIVTTNTQKMIVTCCTQSEDLDCQLTQL